MKIVIGDKTYTELKNISFSPTTDVIGSEVPINQLIAEVKTSDEISTGGVAYLYDENDAIWAKYWIVDAKRMNADFVRLETSSILLLLDRTTMPAKMYSNASLASVVSDIFSNVTATFGSNNYSIDPDFDGVTVSGWCKEQTARERLQWVCFVVGAYIKTYFTDKAEIKAVQESALMIPESDTFWKPTLNYGDYVTAVKVRAYSYTTGTPQTVDKWVYDGVTYYIQTEQDFTLSNPDAPVTAAENVVTVNAVTLVNQDNVSAILSRLAKYYFKRVEVSGSILDDGSYEPGGEYIMSTGDELITGYMKSANFTFGRAKKAAVTIVQSDVVASANLEINYLNGTMFIKKSLYLLPVGYLYSMQNPYLDQVVMNHRYIFYPQRDYATGTIAEGYNVDNEQYNVAIDLYQGVCYIYSVDSLRESGEVVTIG